MWVLQQSDVVADSGAHCIVDDVAPLGSYRLIAVTGISIR